MASKYPEGVCLDLREMMRRSDNNITNCLGGTLGLTGKPKQDMYGRRTNDNGKRKPSGSREQ